MPAGRLPTARASRVRGVTVRRASCCSPGCWCWPAAGRAAAARARAPVAATDPTAAATAPRRRRRRDGGLADQGDRPVEAHEAGSSVGFGHGTGAVFAPAGAEAAKRRRLPAPRRPERRRDRTSCSATSCGCTSTTRTTPRCRDRRRTAATGRLWADWGFYHAARPVRLRGAQPRARRDRHPPRPRHQPGRGDEGAAPLGGIAAARPDRARPARRRVRGAGRRSRAGSAR